MIPMLLKGFLRATVGDQLLTRSKRVRINGEGWSREPDAVMTVKILMEGLGENDGLVIKENDVRREGGEEDDLIRWSS